MSPRSEDTQETETQDRRLRELLARRTRRSLRALTRGANWVGVLLFGALIGTLFAAFFAAGDIYEYVDTVDGAHLPQVDAVVVLAGGRGRIATAGDVWYRYWELSHVPLKISPNGKAPTSSHRKPPIFYVSGMGKGSNWSTLGRQLRRGVLDVMRPENVLLETESTNTEENALVLARFARQRNWDRILLMTSRYHMRRAKFIFEGVFWALERPLDIETLSVYQEPFEPGEWRRSPHGIEVTLSEYVKWVSYKTFWHP